MKPSQILNNISITITILTMSLMLEFLIPKIQNEKYEIIAAILSAAAIYNFLNTFLSYFFNNIRFLKRKLLGKNYLEGTWIGTFENKLGGRNFLVETFEQSLDELLIIGESFNEQGQVISRWKTETTSINKEKSSLIYSYICDTMSDNASYRGIANFNIITETHHKTPRSLRGHTYDITDGKRYNSIEEKISDNILNITESSKEAIKKFK